MSTRSRIGIIRGETDEGTPLVASIYCHFDGYPAGVGQTLIDHWTDPEKVAEMIAHGDMSSLGEIIGEKHDFDRHTADYYSPEARERLDGAADEEEKDKIYREIAAASPHGKGWCLFYGRDRGDDGTEAITHQIDRWPDSGQEALYVFDPETSTWKVSSETMNPVGWNTVTQWEGWISIPEAIERDTQNA